MTPTLSMSSNALADEVVQAYERGDIQQALNICQKLNQHFERFPYGWYLAGSLLFQVKNYAHALKACDRAIALQQAPKHVLLKAKCLFAIGDRAAAKELVLTLCNGEFSAATMHHDLANLLNELELVDQALVHFERAISLDSAPAAFHYNKACVLRFAGNFSAAETSFNAAIMRQPDDCEAYWTRASLRKQSANDNHIAEIESAIKKYENHPKKYFLHFALAKENEDVESYDAAFSALIQANSSKRQIMQYDVDHDLGVLAALTQAYDASMFTDVKGCSDESPIFIVGMPRTGTTLVERILASHSQVHAAGELNNFALEMMRLVRSSGFAGASKSELIEHTKQLDFARLGENYLRSVASVRGDTPFFIDKLPFNYLYAGLIHLALPKAKIIHVQRNPMDTCYAVYKQYFKDAYPFSYDLVELGKYYLAYRDLMEHWKSVLPKQVITTVDYEQLVAQPEPSARALVQACGLDWQDSCLRFYENKGASKTASAVQVRQPVYRSSVNKWQRYAEGLAPLTQLLDQAKVEF